MRYSAAQIDDIKSRNPVDGFAAKYVTLRKSGRNMIGPCPICSGESSSRTATRFECDNDGWVCAVCEDGGDVIRLAARVLGLDPERDFVRVVQHLGGGRLIPEDEQRRIDDERKRRESERARESAKYREKERERAWRRWQFAQNITESQAETYLHRRHALAADMAVPYGAHLRFDPRAPYFVWNPDKKEFVKIYEGPAMLAAITRGDGTFAGVHTTWIDLSRAPKFKGEIINPFTGEIEPTKKIRGSKRGNKIELARCSQPRRLILGEGIEKVLAVWSALVMADDDLREIAAWSSIDLGNLGGPAVANVPHPEIKTPSGRSKMVPGPDPDWSEKGIEIPACVDDLILLGDSTSDKFLTDCAMTRAAARAARPGRTVRIVWAPADMDFDEIMGSAAA